MLAILAAEDARLDAGSVGLALARRWSNHGEPVLLVDADTTGSRLAERFGAARRAEYSPALRGMASLIVAREPLNLKSLADHCYSLDDSQGSLVVAVRALRCVRLPLRGRLAGGACGRSRRDRQAAQSPGVGLSAERRGEPHAAASVLRGHGCGRAAETQESVAALWSMCRDAGLRALIEGTGC